MQHKFLAMTMAGMIVALTLPVAIAQTQQSSADLTQRTYNGTHSRSRTGTAPAFSLTVTPSSTADTSDALIDRVTGNPFNDDIGGTDLNTDATTTPASSISRTDRIQQCRDQYTGADRTACIRGDTSAISSPLAPASSSTGIMESSISSASSLPPSVGGSASSLPGLPDTGLPGSDSGSAPSSNYDNLSLPTGGANIPASCTDLLMRLMTIGNGGSPLSDILGLNGVSSSDATTCVQPWLTSTRQMLDAIQSWVIAHPSTNTDSGGSLSSSMSSTNLTGGLSSSMSSSFNPQALTQQRQALWQQCVSDFPDNPAHCAREQVRMLQNAGSTTSAISLPSVSSSSVSSFSSSLDYLQY